MVLAASGGVQHEQMVKLANAHLGSLPNVYSEGQPPVPDRCRFTGMSETANWISCWKSNAYLIFDLFRL